MVKRPASQAASPPPPPAGGSSSTAASPSASTASTSTAAQPPKAKKPRPSKPKQPKKTKPPGGTGAAGGGAAGSKKAGKGGRAGSPVDRATSPAMTAAAAARSPSRGQSPFVGAGGVRASSPVVPSPKAARERSGSVVAGEPRGAAKGKGKERQRDKDGGADDGDEQDENAQAAGGVGEGQEEQDAEDEVLVFSDDEFGSNAKEIAKQKEDLRVLLEHFDAEQMNRYEHYRRSGLNKASVRKLVNQVLGQSVSPSILTVVRGFAKVFVGEIVEKARATNPHAGPLTPQDLRDAYRVYLDEHDGAGKGGRPGGAGRKKMFVK
ncbi:hypothetical protein JCM10212_001651 [Sporobolomyces blumeae]